MLVTALIASLLAAAPAQDELVEDSIAEEQIVVLGEDEFFTEDSELDESQEILFEGEDVAANTEE